MEDQELSVQVSPSVIYEQDKAAIDMQISTAKAYPRNIQRCVSNAIAIVTLDQETAKTCTYSLPRGGKPLTGPSVHLAKILAQCFGNLRVDAKVVSIDDNHITSESVCFDLENNLAIKHQVKRSIVGKTGRFSNDMITVTGNAANSIAMRNAILSVIPRGIVDKIYNAAKQVITGDISDEQKLIATRKKVVDGLKSTYNVQEAEILGAIGKHSIDHITGDDIVVLIGIGTAIKEGETTVQEAFKPKPALRSKAETELQRIKDLVDSCKTEEQVKELQEKHGKDYDALIFEMKIEQIKNHKNRCQ